MKKIPRRTFVGGMIAGGAAALLAPRTVKATDSRIDILLNEPVGTIAPEIYSHFIEHLGGVIYDGVWVGEGSKVPNAGGIRKALIDSLKQLKPGVVRWPGGCFADSYDWRDGIGPRKDRPQRTDFWADATAKDASGPQVYDPNAFGTNEFMRFCKLTGSQPYFAANVRSLTGKDFYEWVEYCNAPANATTLSRMRAAAGDAEPFSVRYWGVGNESWGCGGNMTAEEYAVEFRKFIGWVPHYGLKLAFIASGPNGGDRKWTRGLFTKLAEKGDRFFDNVYGLAMHYYCGSTGKRDAGDFPESEWYELLGRANRMESIIIDHWATMGEIDTRHRVKLIVDEWGAWHARDKDMPENYLWAYAGSLRDALVSGLTLDTFNRHADKVVMANAAQLINTIHSCFLAYEDKFIVTPNYHVFEMYAAHQGGTSLRTLFAAPAVNYSVNNMPNTLWGLQGSASLKDKQLVLTVVNPHATEARETEIAVRGAAIKSGESRTLTASDLRARNTFANPHGLEPTNAKLNVSGSNVTFKFAPASVTRLTLALS